MRRVAVVGPGGGGKSTLARGLAARLGVAYVGLDEAFWRPGWVETPRDDWRAWQEQRFADDAGWVADGNYGGTFDVRFAVADTVVVVQPARWRCAAGVLSRYLRAPRAEVAPGCRQRVTLRFLWWVWRYPVTARPRLDRALRRHPHLDVVELRSRREARAWLAAR